MITERNVEQYKRRRFLTVATSFIAGAGVAGAAVPFIQSWQPSARARALGAPVKVNITKIEPGSMVTVEWQGKPVWILRRTEKNIEQLSNPVSVSFLRDPNSEINQQPDYAKNTLRSLRPDLFVCIGICTHLGCVPTYKPEGYEAETNSLYFCACHGSKFDLAGRVYKNVPAPTNLIIPPHQYISEKVIEIGVDEQTVA